MVSAAPISSSERRPPKERILAAALAMVRAEGLQALSQGRAAAAAGLRQSHLTYYFPTRKDLLKGLVQSIRLEMMETISAPSKGRKRPTIAGVRSFFAERIRQPLLARLMLALTVAADEDPSLRDWLANFHQDVLKHFREMFAGLGVHPSDAELGLFHATIVGAGMMSAQLGTEAAAKRSARLVSLAFDRLLQGAPRVAASHRRQPRTKRTTSGSLR